MKIQQSAKPYLFLLLFLLIGIPYCNYYLEQAQETTALTVEVTADHAPLPVAEIKTPNPSALLP